MRLLLLLPVMCALVSCGTQKVTSPAEYPVTFTHKIKGDRLTVNATVTNNTPGTISLVKNPNFYSISVRALTRGKDQTVRPKIVTYGPAVSKNVAVLAPGHSTTFSTDFQMRRLLGGPIEVERVEQAHGPRSFMIISDDTFKTTFSYEHYPRFLTERAQKVGQNFLTKPLRGQSSFRRPYFAMPSTTLPPAPAPNPVRKKAPLTPEII